MSEVGAGAPAQPWRHRVEIDGVELFDSDVMLDACWALRGFLIRAGEHSGKSGLLVLAGMRLYEDLRRWSRPSGHPIWVTTSGRLSLFEWPILPVDGHRDDLIGPWQWQVVASIQWPRPGTTGLLPGTANLT